MGGNALKQYRTDRLAAVEYAELVRDFIDRFHADICPTTELNVIPAYPTKPSHGDADIIVTGETLPADWIDRLKETFELGPTQFVKNSNCVSIGWKHFQIDLIVTPQKFVQSALFYFAFNDLGNLLGRQAHKLGIKVGHKGISLVVRHKDKSDHILQEITLSTDSVEILDILGLTLSDWSSIATREDIFKFVASSKFFDPDIYLLDNRNATSRIRDKKRQTYTDFLLWVQETNPPATYNFPRKLEHGGYSIREPFYTDIVLKRWPWVEQVVNDLKAKFEYDQKFKSVFNGSIVMQVLDNKVSGVQLGHFMSFMNATITESPDDLKSVFIASPKSAVEFIKEQYASFQMLHW